MHTKEFIKIFSDAEIVGNKIVLKNDIAEAIDYIKQNYHYNMLKEIMAVDLGDEGIELNYNLFSVENEEDLIISTIIENEAESISHIFDSAIADENEIYDLFGVNFIGHEDLKRLYMPECWKGNPLRKDYVEDDERLRWND